MSGWSLPGLASREVVLPPPCQGPHSFAWPIPDQSNDVDPPVTPVASPVCTSGTTNPPPSPMQASSPQRATGDTIVSVATRSCSCPFTPTPPCNALSDRGLNSGATATNGAPQKGAVSLLTQLVARKNCSFTKSPGRQESTACALSLNPESFFCWLPKLSPNNNILSTIAVAVES
jgi:hypothetical protein